jgi:hypothetical protein
LAGGQGPSLALRHVEIHFMPNKKAAIKWRPFLFGIRASSSSEKNRNSSR